MQATIHRATFLPAGVALAIAVLMVPSFADDKKLTTRPATPSARPVPPPRSAPAARPPQPAARPPQPAARPAQPAQRPSAQPSQPGASHPVYRPSGGVSGTRPPSNSSSGNTGTRPAPNAAAGGITGTRPTSNAATGGITGTRPAPNAAAGGITGTRPTSNAATGGITGTRPAPNAATGGITGTRPSAGITGSAGTRERHAAPIYHPGANVRTSANPDGSRTHINAKTGATIHTDANGRIHDVAGPGFKASGFRADGRATHIDRTLPDGRRLTVDRSLAGERRVETVRPGGVKVVTVGNRGYVEHPLRPGYVQRTYVGGGRNEVVVYRSITYNHVVYYGYVPRVYYAPAYYIWIGSPWRSRVIYAWGWDASPGWYSYQNGYFAASPDYPDASYWLADYAVSQDLQNGYNDQLAANGNVPPPPPDAPAGNGSVLTSEVKAQIAADVRRQIEAERAAAAQPGNPGRPDGTDANLPAALDPNQRIFVVSSSIDLMLPNNQDCSLTPGDIIERSSPVQTSDGKVPVDVLSSKPGDCPAATASALDVAWLQEMVNQFRDQVSSGMESLAALQGHGGLPPGPPADPRQASDAQAPPDSNADALVKEQLQQADFADQQVTQASNSGV